MPDTTLDLLERAHAKLTELRDAATEGPWTYRPTILERPNSTVMGGEGKHAGYVSVGQFAGNGPLIVALHRTIDAQRTLLLDAIHRYRFSDVPVSAECTLARAILDEPVT